MKKLVTGGSGFIGSHLVRKLCERGHEVAVLSRNPHPISLEDLNDKIEIIDFDFNNFSSHKIFKEVDTVYHLAWSSLPRNNASGLIEDLNTSVVWSIKLIEECIRNNVKKFIFASSGGAVYGQTHRGQLISEHLHPKPISKYGIAKLFVEQYLHYFKHHNNFDFVIARIANAYGERPKINQSQGVISVWLNKILNNEAIDLYGDGLQVRDYVYVGDVVESLSLLNSSVTDNEVYNIGSSHGLNLRQLLEIIQSELKCKIEVNNIDYNYNDVAYNVLNIDKIRAHLSWNTTVPIREGIRKTFEYLSKNQID